MVANYFAEIVLAKHPERLRTPRSARGAFVVAALLICSVASAGIAAAAPDAGKKATARAAAASKATKNAATAKVAKPASKAYTIDTNGRAKVLEFSAAYCVPCRKFAPNFEKLKEQFAGKADFEVVPFDKPEGQAIANKYDVMSVPTVLIFDTAGKLCYRTTGALNEKELTGEISKVAP
jgi:thioredoxin 1